MTKSKAAQQATRRYQAKAYDSVNLLLPKGTKDLIKATGESVNGFINKAVADRLEAMNVPIDQTKDEQRPGE